MIPIFRSHHSLLQSCLTVDEIPKPEDFKEKAPLSIFTIAKNHNLKDVYLLDTSFSGFIEAFKAAQKGGFNLRYGIQFYCCEDINTKDEASLNSEHKLAIWATSIKGIDVLKKIYSISNTTGFYYQGRIDLEHIKQNWNSDLLLTVPFYDSFLFNNLTFFNRNIVPDWGNIKPIFFIEDHGLPFDSLIEKSINEYCKLNNFETQKSHLVYYYKKEDFYDYMVLRCIKDRRTLDKPNMNFLCSDEFSFESYLEKVS